MTNSEVREVDVAIIGAGTAGLAAMATIKRVTDRFVIIDDGPLGTTCARVGCMPSKAMIEIAHDVHRARRLGERGLGSGQFVVDGPAVMARVRDLRDYFASGPARVGTDPHFLKGRATFTSPTELRVGDVTVRAAKIIIATGTTPIVPPPWRAFPNEVMTSDEVFELKAPPRSCAVIGAGPLGIELSQTLARLGTRVRTFATGPGLGGLTDPAVRAVANKLLGPELGLHVGRPADPFVAAGGVGVRADDESIVVERALVTVGRSANTKDLNLGAIGARVNERGVPDFDPRTMQLIGVPTVYIAGDVTEDRPVMHEATFAGRLAAAHATGATELPKRPPKLSIVFTDPNIAAAGATHAELSEGSAPFVIGTVDFADQGRARTRDEAGGILNVYGEPKTGRLLGAEMICPGGEHLAHLLAFALARGSTAAQVLDLPFYHPTLEEGLRTALVDLVRNARV